MNSWGSYFVHTATIKTKYWVRYEICHVLCIYMTDMKSLISIVLFHFIFNLLSIFMVMINIKKIELMNATESWSSNLFSVKNIFLPSKLWLIHSIFIWSRPSVYIKYIQKSCSSILSSSKIFNFVEYVEIESCFINKTL